MNTIIKDQNTARQFVHVSVKDIGPAHTLTQQRILSEIWKATERAVKGVLQARRHEKAALVQQHINFTGVALPGDSVEIITQVARLEQEMEIVVRLQKKTKGNGTAIAGAKLVYYVYQA